MGKRISAYIGMAALAALPLLQGCAASDARLAEARPAAVAQQQQQQAIPFTAASVTADGAASRIDWTAPGAGRVTVYAGTNPTAIAHSNPVGQGGETGSLRLPAAPADSPRQFFALVPDHGAPLVIADHSLHLASVPNLRDIGGYRTADGHWVKMGLLYRSDQLDRLSDADLAELHALGIHLIADLRTVSERQREPDRVPPGAEHLVLDVSADRSGTLGGDMRQAMQMIASGKGAEMLTAANRDFVSLAGARAAYTTLLARIGADDAGPTLYHCTAGKDRTGWASAVILTLLGVPRETVMADYLASNTYLRAKNAAMLVAAAKSSHPIDPAFLEPVMTVRPSYLEAALAEVEQRYGSFDEYRRQALGIDDAALARLRARYLMP